MRKIYFIRHGQTVWNTGYDSETGTYLGKPITHDYNPSVFPEWLEMTKKGHEQAKRTAQTLTELVKNPSAIFSSEENRAIETAKYSVNLFNSQLIKDSRLNEYEKGRGLENDEQAFARINRFIEELIIAEHSISLIFSHQQIISQYLSKKCKNFKKGIKNCEIIETEIRESGLVIVNRYFNHLDF